MDSKTGEMLIKASMQLKSVSYILEEVSFHYDYLPDGKKEVIFRFLADQMKQGVELLDVYQQAVNY